MEERRRAGDDVETIAAGLPRAAQPSWNLYQPTFDLSVIAVPLRSAGELPLLVVRLRADRQSSVRFYWWEGDRLHEQTFPRRRGALRLSDDPQGFDPQQAPIAARQQVRNGVLELGVVYVANDFGSAPFGVFRLLRLEADRWHTVWDGLSQGERRWKTSHTGVTFTGDPNVPAGTRLDWPIVRSSSWHFRDGQDEIFHESNPGPHRWFEDVWERRGDGYELVSSRIEPSAYAALVEFVYRLGQGDESGAAELVTEPDLLEQARALGLDRTTTGGWSIDPYPDGREWRGPIRIRRGPPALIRFVDRGGAWLIASVEDNRPQPDVVLDDTAVGPAPCPRQAESVAVCGDPFRASWQAWRDAAGYRVELIYPRSGERFAYSLRASRSAFAFPPDAVPGPGVSPEVCRTRQEHFLDAYVHTTQGVRLLGSVAGSVTCGGG